MKKFLSLIFLLMPLIAIRAQDLESTPEMADGLFASGKIYVVVVVLSLILTGIFVYLLALDRKLSRIEKEMEKQN